MMLNTRLNSIRRESFISLILMLKWDLVLMNSTSIHHSHIPANVGPNTHSLYKSNVKYKK